MIDPTVQEVRNSVDQTLQIVKDSIGLPVLETYKSKINPSLYLPMIRALLEEVNPAYDTAPLVDDTALLEKLDLNHWLTLIQERWDLFEKTLRNTDMGHVKDLKQLRNKWAHHNDISVREAYDGARAAAELLKSFGCTGPVQALDYIREQLELKIRKIEPQPPPAQGEWRIDSALSTTSNGKNGEHDAVHDGATQPLTTFDDSKLHLQIVPRNGAAAAQRVPLIEERLVIGRGLHAHIKVIDPRVSRVHLLIAKTSPTELKVTDLMSANGTTLDGTELKANHPTAWKVGQTINVGNTWLILRQGTA